MKIAVLGSGGWGTALAMLLEEKRPPGHPVVLSGAGVQAAPSHGGKPPAAWGAAAGGPVLHLGLGLRGGQRCGGDGHPLLRGAVHRRADCRPALPGTILVSVSKGIEKGTFLRMSQIIREATGDRFPVVTLSGPSHAEEVARKVPTAVVSASPDRAAAEQVQDLFLNDHFRVYSSSDVVGGRAGGRPEKRHGPCAPAAAPAWGMGTIPRPCS